MIGTKYKEKIIKEASLKFWRGWRRILGGEKEGKKELSTSN